MYKWALILTVFIVQPLFAAEKMTHTGEIFDKTGKEKKYDYERFEDVQGDKVIVRSVYKDTSGDVLTEEKMETLKGNLVRYDMEQKQLKQKAWIEQSDKEIIFNLKKFRKRNYPQTEKRVPNFIMGLQISSYVIAHWADLLAKKEKEIRLGVWDRQETVGFTLSNDGDKDGAMVVKMNPTSFLIKAVVSPIYFHYNKKTKDLVKYVGRVVPKEKRGRDYYDYDGLVLYKKL